MNTLTAKTKLWSAIVTAVMVLSVLRGIRFPNLWSYTHFLFTYEAGFTKRALLGALMNELPFPYLSSYAFFAWLSIALLLVNFILINGLLWRLVKSKNLLMIAAALLFASSMGVVFWAHSVGYADHWGLLLVLLVLYTPGFYRKALLCTAFLAFMLVHEGIVFLYFPLLLIILLCDTGIFKNRKKQVVVGLFVVAVLAISALLSASTLSKESVNQMRRTVEARVEDPARRDAFVPLYRDAKVTFEKNRLMWQSPRRLGEFINSLLVVVPTASLLLFLAWLAMSQAGLGWVPRVAGVLAVSSPLALHLIAWDMHRWNTLWIMTSLMLLAWAFAKSQASVQEASIYEATENQQTMTQSGWLLPVMVLVICLNLMSTVPLFDRYHVKSFPFKEHQQTIQKWWHIKQIEVRPPSR